MADPGGALIAVPPFPPPFSSPTSASACSRESLTPVDAKESLAAANRLVIAHARKWRHRSNRGECNEFIYKPRPWWDTIDWASSWFKGFIFSQGCFHGYAHVQSMLEACSYREPYDLLPMSRSVRNGIPQQAACRRDPKSYFAGSYSASSSVTL